VPRYDLFNTLSTFGQDARWRKLVVRYANLPPGGRALDVATGTGAVAFALARSAPTAAVEGLDFCAPMIEAAQAKAGVQLAQPTFVVGDVLSLPYEDQSFDCLTISFGLRNVADIPRALSEMRRVLKPGGRFVCLELTHPRSQLIKVGFQVYFYKLAPLLGAWLSGDRNAYSYLPHSLTAFPTAPVLARHLRQAGLRDVQYRRMNFGTIAIHRAVR